jgi:hypothetical protein
MDLIHCSEGLTIDELGWMNGAHNAPTTAGGVHIGRSASSTALPRARCTEVDPVNASTGAAIAGSYYSS